MSRRLTDVVRQLIEQIVSGELAEGELLPPEQRLAADLGAGRGVVREAIRVLESHAMVQVLPRRGVAVRSSDRWRLGDADVLLPAIERGQGTALLREAIGARTALERVAAAHVALHATNGDLTLLRERVEAMARAEVEGATTAANAEAAFHHALCSIGDNRVLTSLAEPLHRVLAELRTRRAPNGGRAALRHHRRILEGVSSHDPLLAGETVDAYGRALARWTARH